jgi:hypothetical protein
MKEGCFNDKRYDRLLYIDGRECYLKKIINIISGVRDKITVFADFHQLSAEKMAFFLKHNIIIHVICIN